MSVIKEEITEDMKLRSTFRAQLLSLIWIVLAIVILLRVLYIETIKHSYYSSLADKQYVSSGSTFFDRGAIYFSSYKKGSVSAGELVSTYRIAIDPSIISDLESVYKKLSEKVDMDKDTFLQKANKKDDPYEEVAKGVKEEDINYLKTQFLMKNRNKCFCNRMKHIKKSKEEKKCDEPCIKIMY